MTEPTTRRLGVPGATLTYDLRGSDAGDKPALVLIGAPMGAAGFTTLAGFFTDRTVVAYDPRGVERSQRDDGGTGNVHRLIEALAIAPVDLFGSSGGAVNALALVAHHPRDVRVLVAHEPPDAAVLPDREAALAAVAEVHQAYERQGLGHGMAKFIALVSHRGEVPADFVDRPDPDPAAFGLPTADDGSRDDVMLGRHLIEATSFEPDVVALRAAPTRIVLAAGVASEGELAHRGAFAVARRLGTEVVMFPDGHAGFLGGEYGQSGEPEAFAAKLREVLDG